jgi:tetratricopeptide (TPR) repeat protein
MIDFDLQILIFVSIGRLYIAAAYYYLTYKHDLPTAINACESGLSLACSTGNIKQQCDALNRFAWIKWYLGDYPAAQIHAYESRRLAITSADLYREAQGLRIEAVCMNAVGNYRESIFLCKRAKYVLGLCGMLGSTTDQSIMNSQAEIHTFKSEYVEARNIHGQILKEWSLEDNPLPYGCALINIAHIDVSLGASTSDVLMNIHVAKSIFTEIENHELLHRCQVVEADLKLRERDMLGARSLFGEILWLSWGNDSELVTWVLERLGDVSRWESSIHMLTGQWTAVFLVHSLKLKQKLEIHKALQFLGDVFLRLSDEDTAISLFTIALEGFIRMDVHRSQAECLLRLGEISQRRDNLQKAVGLWERARPLFERSSQTAQIAHIDAMLAGTDKTVLEKGFLEELKVPAGATEEIGNDLTYLQRDAGEAKMLAV